MAMTSPENRPTTRTPSMRRPRSCLPGFEEHLDRDVGEQPGSGGAAGADLHDAAEGGEDRTRHALGSGRGDPAVAARQAARQSHCPASSCSPVPYPRITTTS
jgi:hypothetical protein